MNREGKRCLLYSRVSTEIDFDNTSLDKMAIAERAEKRKPQEKTTYKNM